MDLGCAPGGWLQVLAGQVGPEGRVLGVDTAEVAELGAPITLLRVDLTEPEAPERIAQALGRPADAVLCDAAPRLSGIRDVDRAAEEEIQAAALRIAGRVLRPGGGLVVKGFPGPHSDRFRAALRQRFGRVSEVHPEGTRQSSKEFYLLADAAGPKRKSRLRSRRGKRA